MPSRCEADAIVLWICTTITTTPCRDTTRKEVLSTPLRTPKQQNVPSVSSSHEKDRLERRREEELVIPPGKRPSSPRVFGYCFDKSALCEQSCTKGVFLGGETQRFDFSRRCQWSEWQYTNYQSCSLRQWEKCRSSFWRGADNVSVSLLVVVVRGSQLCPSYIWSTHAIPCFLVWLQNQVCFNFNRTNVVPYTLTRMSSFDGVGIPIIVDDEWGQTAQPSSTKTCAQRCLGKNR